MEPETAQKISKFFSKYPLKRFAKNQIIIYGSEEPAGIYQVVSGIVRQYDINKKGSELVVNVFQPEAFFPLDWVFGDGSNRYFFETYTAVEVRFAPVDETLAFLRSNNDVLLGLIKSLYGALAVCNLGWLF